MKSAGYAVKRAPRWSESSSADPTTPRILVLLALAFNLHPEALKQSNSLKPVLGNEKRKRQEAPWPGEFMIKHAHAHQMAPLHSVIAPHSGFSQFVAEHQALFQI
jgi:hypothetical protein